MATQRPLILDTVNGFVRELITTDKLGGITGGTATNEVMTQDQFGTNSTKMIPSGSPTFLVPTATQGVIVGNLFVETVRLQAAAGSGDSGQVLSLSLSGANRTLQLANNFSIEGGFVTVIRNTTTTDITLPATGTLAAIAGDQNLSITNAAPSLTLNDSTAAAKDARFRVDGNYLYITEAAGTDGDCVAIDITSNRFGLGIVPAAAVDIAKSDAGNAVQMRCKNTDNTNAASHARITAITGGTSSGDPSIYCGVTGQSYDWTVGVDVSAAGIFFISHSTAIGTNPAISFDLSMNATLYQNLTMTDAKNIICGGTTGNKIATSATAQKIGLWNTTAIVQPTASGQAALAAQGQQTLTDSTTGTASTVLAAIVGALYTTDAPAIRNAIASLAAQLALVKTDMANTRTLLTAIRDAMVAFGSMKGS